MSELVGIAILDDALELQNLPVDGPYENILLALREAEETLLSARLPCKSKRTFTNV